MSISEVIANYFHEVSYGKWDLFSCFDSVLEACKNITSEDCEKIKTELSFHLRSISTHNSMSKKVHNKANRLLDELDQFFQSKRVTMIIDERDTKVNEKMLNTKAKLYNSEVNVYVACDKLASLHSMSSSTGKSSSVLQKIQDEDDELDEECDKASTSKIDKNVSEKDSQEPAKKKLHISDDQELIAKNLLGESQEISPEMQSLLRDFQEYSKYSRNLLIINEIMDLRPSSEFVLMYTKEEHYSELLKDVFDPIDKLFPEKAFNFLMAFFSKNLTNEQWRNEIENLLDHEPDPFLKNLKRFMFEILPIFFDSYMHPDNPLKNRDLGEDEYMTIYIHPMLKKALARFSNINYRPGNRAIEASSYRKLITSQSGNADRADGIAYTTNAKPYEICVVEGSKPYDTETRKESEDFVQNTRAGKDMINFLVTQEVKQKRALPTLFKAFMVQSFELSLRFYFMDYLNYYRIFEIEICEIPIDFTGINLFPFLFRTVVIWAMLVGNTDKEFQEFRNSKRSSRISNAHNLRVLTQLAHNKERPGDKKSLKMKNVL
ncbi:209_t:CDS:2 [Ambispora gerdemannii]|uniref:209_t:CDS:1 n=1 Tax=Ambispora gerdemannii TaxID=144530 RepID=A0A9N9GAJ5_9GLOM|nr:209_t:CDS:2 [Ambispora gerdemannii]